MRTMYFLVLVVSLAMAAPRVSRNCYTLCDLQKANPSSVAPRDCNCSLLDVMDAESASKELTLLDDTGVYFVPAEADLFQAQFTPQPFLISNPVKFHAKINRIKKGSADEKDSSNESSERMDTYEKSQTFVRISTNDGSNPPSYLDLEIQDVASGETTVIQQGNFIPSFESAEKALVECLDLHILDFTRKHGSVENFNEFWEARNLKIYEDLSNSDLTDKIKKYCSETETLIERSLQDIKRGVPKKKANLKHIPKDKNDTTKKYETYSSIMESTFIHDNRTDQHPLLNNSMEHNLLLRQHLDNSFSKYESTLEDSSTPYLSHNTSPTADKINESKDFDINSHTIGTTKKSEKAYDTEFDMDTMPSEVIFKTIEPTHQFNSESPANNRNSNERPTLFISTTPLIDTLPFGDSSGNTEKSWAEKQEDNPGKDIVFDLNTTFSQDMNNSNIENLTKEPMLEETTIFSALRSPPTEKQTLGDISLSTERHAAETEEETIETTDFAFGDKPSADILKSDHITNLSDMNMVSNELNLDNVSLFPASTSKYDEISLEDLSRNSESSLGEKQVPEKGKAEKELDLDLDTKPSEVILISNNESDKTSSERMLDNVTFDSKSTTLNSEEISPGYRSSNLETFKTEQEEESKDGGTQLHVVTMSSDITFKPGNELNEASNEPISDDITFFPTTTTTSQKYKELLETASGNTERSMTKLPEKYSDGDIDHDLNTMTYNVINIPNSKSIIDDPLKFRATSKTSLSEKPLMNLHEETISNTSPKEETTVDLISTTPLIVVQSRNMFRENEVQIPTIVTKECQNNIVQSFINGNEELPNNDFEHTDTNSQSLEKQVSTDDHNEHNSNSSVEGIDATLLNNSYVSGNLYFGSSQDLVPVRILQTDSGKVSLGIDGDSLCEKLNASNKKSLLLSTLCDCVQKITKSNSTEYLNK